MEGMPGTKPTEEQYNNKVREEVTVSQEAASQTREELREIFKGKIPDDETFEDIRDINIFKYSNGEEELMGSVKRHLLKIRSGQGSEGAAGYFDGSLDGDQLTEAEAEKLFLKYKELNSKVREYKAITNQAKEEVTNPESELYKRAERKQKAIDELMEL